jgi:hypothetical protein
VPKDKFLLEMLDAPVVVHQPEHPIGSGPPPGSTPPNYCAFI